jgi:hypothetical protein
MPHLAESDSRHLERLSDLVSIVTRCIECGLADNELADVDNWPRLHEGDKFNPFSHLDLAYNAIRLASLDWDDPKNWVDHTLWFDPTLDGEPRPERIGGSPLATTADKQASPDLTNKENKVKAGSLF